MKRELTHGSLFSGVEGFGLGATLAGIKTEWSCEFEKYVGRLVSLSGEKVEVVGYRDNEHTFPLIVDASKIEGWYWEFLDPQDVVVKKCERYWYASINDLID